MTAATDHRRDRGAVIPLVALVLPVLVLMTAFAVDLGRQRTLRRDLQAAADVIALDLSRIIDPATKTAPDNLATLTALEGSLKRNGLDPVTSYHDVDVSGVEVEWGTWTRPTSGDQCPAPIITEAPTCFEASTQNVNAVRVTLSDDIDYFFQPGTGSATRSAVAALGDEPSAEHLLGSTLVSITPTGNWIIGAVLQEIIPGADLVGYGGLANADVTLADLAVALGAGSVEELADTTVTYEQLVLATIQALEASGGDAAAVGVLQQLINLGIEEVQVDVGEVLGLGNGSTSGLDGRVAIPQLLLTGVGVATGSHTIHIPDTVLNVAGLGSVTADLSVIEPPVRIGTAHEASGSTRQVHLGLSIELGISGDRNQRLCDLDSDERSLLGSILGGLFQLLNCLLAPLTSALLDVDINGSIDLDLTLSEVSSTQRIDCAASTIRTDFVTGPASIDVDPQVSVDVHFGGRPLTLLGLSAPASAVTASGASGSATFTADDAGPRHTVFSPATSRVGAPNLGLANLLTINGLQLTVVNQDLPQLGGIARGLVAPTLNFILGEVDRLVVTELSRLLGLNLGGADITPQWLECEETTVRLVG